MLDPPGTSKTKLPCRRESNFQYFIVLILSSLWDSILAPKTFQNRAQDGPKSFQIRGQNFNELGSGFWSQLGSNLGPNLGVKKGTPAWFWRFLRWWKSAPDFHHAILGPKALRDRFLIDFCTLFDWFLIKFWPIFHRSWTLALILGWGADCMSCCNWLV